MSNNSGELAIIITNNEETVFLPNEIPSQYFTLTGYQILFDTAQHAQDAGGLLYVQIDDYLSVQNVLDTNPSFTSIPLTYLYEATPTNVCFNIDGIARHYKTNRMLPNYFTMRVYNSAKALLSSVHLSRIVLYFSLDESQIFRG